MAGSLVCFFCFKQKTGYEVRISDWSSDVCSSDLGIGQFGRANEGVAVQPAQPREFGIFEPWNGAEQPHLLGVLELGLEADDVPERGRGIVLTQLDDGIDRKSTRLNSSH